MSVKAARPYLTPDDIRRLVKGETPEERAQLAHKLCLRIATEPLGADEKLFADEILALVSRDAAELVRRAMSVTLRNSPKLPRSVALRLAKDVDSVALPVIKGSPVFTDQDLIEIVSQASEPCQIAVASRARLRETVTDAIAERGSRNAVRVMAANNGAEISNHGFGTVLSRFDSDSDVHGALVSREHLPVHICEKMVTLVVGELFDKLVSRHELPPQLAIELASGARERATLDLVEQAGRSSDLERFVQQLQLNGRLTPSLVMRALCVGHMSFVEWAVAELAGIPHKKAWLMLHDAGTLGLKTIFERTSLPPGMFKPFRAAIEVYHELDYDMRANDRERFRRRMIERVLTQFQAMPKDDLDYLLDKLDAIAMSTGQGRRQATG